MSYNKLNGSIDTSLFSNSLKALDLSNNFFNGQFSFEKISSQVLRSINLENNEFSGTINTASLPQSMRKLHVSANRFSGTFDFIRLPRSLTSLRIDNNNFNGSIDLTSLPSNIREIRADGNGFSGSLELGKVKSKLSILSLFQNGLSGNVTIASSIERIDLRFNNFDRQSSFVTFKNMTNFTRVLLGTNVACDPSIYCNEIHPLPSQRSGSLCVGMDQCEMSCGKCRSSCLWRVDFCL